MIKRLVFLACGLFFLISASGCATTRRQNDLEVQGLKNQVSALEAQLTAKDDEIASLRENLTNSSEPDNRKVSSKQVNRKKKRVVGEVKSRPNVRQIQIALANAGYNPGVTDGRMGGQTRDAIRAFQRTHNLAVDGKVGKKSWLLLREYLYKKLK